MSTKKADPKSKAALKKKSDTKKELSRALEDEKPASRLRDKKKQEQKKRRLRYLYAGGALVFAYIGYLLFVPFKGGLNFGVCKVFLELYVQYPDTLKLSTVEDFGSSYRIWFTHIDSFGEYRLDHMQCFYRPDEQTGFALEKVTVGRREVEKQVVDDFNRSIRVIIEYPPDLTFPAPIPDSLSDIEIQTDSFRRKIFE